VRFFGLNLDNPESMMWSTFLAHFVKSFGMLLVAGLAAPMALAALGTEVYERPLDPICRILIYEGDGKLASLCSGVLTSKTQILTARHCFFNTDAKSTYQVSCGFIKGNQSKAKIEITGGGNKVYTQGVSFRENNLAIRNIQVVGWEDGDRISDAIENLNSTARTSPNTNPNLGVNNSPKKVDPRDLAAINLLKPSLLTPFSALSETRLRMNPAFDKCWIAGFGVAEDAMAGVLRVGPLHFLDQLVHRDQNGEISHSPEFRTVTDADDYDENIDPDSLESRFRKDHPKATRHEMKKKLIFKTIGAIQGKMIFKSSIMPGDSGGPLLCQLADDSKVYVMGIAKAGGFAVQKISDTVRSKVAYSFHLHAVWTAIDRQGLVDISAFRKQGGLEAADKEFNRSVHLSIPGISDPPPVSPVPPLELPESPFGGN